MCIICVEFARTKDLLDARRMLESARREPKALDPAHMVEVEETLRKAEAAVRVGKKDRD